MKTEKSQRLYVNSVDSVDVIRVIRVKSNIGEGTGENPARYLYHYWDLEGNLLARKDTLEDA